MTGDIIVALIALIGVLVPVYWGSRADARDRTAMKELADLLDVLPDDLETRADLRQHLNKSITAYVGSTKPQVATLNRLHSQAVALMVVGLVVLLSAGALWLVKVDVPDPAAWEIWGGPALAFIGYLMAYGGWWRWMKWRREKAYLEA
jgi:hypothetical protein